MRFIDLEALNRSDPELKKALADLDAATAKVLSEQDPDKRRELIKKSRDKWVKLRPHLAKLSHDKCWYLECRNPGTDDDVDHFRPKLAVDEDKTHPGYYWLAFNLDNLRLSCHRANRPRTDDGTGETGGKADHFPLVGSTVRAFHPGDDIEAESPGLLDPTDPSDIRFISFRPNGEAFLTPRYATSAESRERFEYSRRYLHLNWPSFVEERLDLQNQIERLVQRGKRSFERKEKAALKDVVRDLRRLMAPDALYSAAATNFIEAFRYLEWIDDVVLRGIN